MSGGWSGEWRLVFRDRAYMTTLLLLGLLAASTFAAGHLRAQAQRQRCFEYQRENQEQQAILMGAFASEEDRDDFTRWAGRQLSPAEEARARQLQSRARTPLLLAYLSDIWRTWLPPSPLAPLSVGESAAWPESYLLRSESTGATLNVSRLSNPFHARTGMFDLSLLVVVLLPLSVIVALHDLISAERERKTLRLILTQPVSLWGVCLRKLIVRLSGIIVVVVGVPWLGLLWTGAEPGNPQVVARFAAWGMLVALYALFWGGLAWLVNAFRGSSVSNAVLLTLAWVLLVIVVPPRLAQQVAEAWPVESPAILMGREQALLRAHEEAEQQRYEQFQAEQSEEDPEARREQWQAIAQASEQALDSQLQELVRMHFQRYEARQAARGRWEWLSPALGMKSCCDLLAGTDASHYRLFARYTGEFQESLRRYWMAMAESEREPTRETMLAMPVYANPGIELVVPWRGLLLRAGSLLAASLLLFLVGGWRLQSRADPG